MAQIRILELSKKNNKINAKTNAKGHLSFSSEASKLLKYETDSYFKIGIDDENNERIYLIKTNSKENAIRFNKSGNSFYLKFEIVLNELKYDFNKNSYTFKIEKNEDDKIKIETKGEVFVLTKSESTKHTKTTKEKITKQEIETDNQNTKQIQSTDKKNTFDNIYNNTTFTNGM